MHEIIELSQVTMSPVNNSDQQQQYIVSMDSLDLSLLSQYLQKPTDEKRLLWSKPLMDGESVYCKVQIPADDYQDEDAHIERSENYLCHICNIDVPHQYVKQHNKSRIHQNYKKLTETVLENVLKQMNVDIDYNNNEKQCDKFYCETCSKVVLLKHERQHNRSNYHLKSIENQRLAENFIESYIKHKEDENRNVENIGIGNQNIVEEDNSSDTDWNFDSDNDDEIVTKFQEMVHINEIVPNNVQTSNMNPGPSISNGLNTSKEITDFKLYLTEMLVRHKLEYILPPIEDDSIVIVTPKGYKEKISVDTFHGFKRVNNFIYCQLCWISMEKDPGEHMRTKEHVMQMIQPIDDNFIRTLSILKEGWGHCLLCNLTVNSSNHVAVSTNHKKYTETDTSNKSTTSIKVEVKPKKTFCDVCKINIDTHNFQVHLKAKKHINNLKPAPNPSQVTAKKTEAISGNVVQNNVNINYCDVCKVNVPSGGMAIHKAGKPHKNKLLSNIQNTLKENLNDLNKFIAVGSSIKTDLQLPSTSTANPGTTLPSKSKEKQLTKEEKIVLYKKQVALVSDTAVKCLVCDLNVPNLERNVIEHMEGVRHRKVADLLLSVNKIVKVSSKFYYCELCKVELDNFIDHINKGIQHNVKIISNSIINKVNLRKYVYEEPSNYDSIATAYRIVYQGLLDKNKIIRLNATSFYCSICSVNLSRINEIDHMLGDKHRHINLMK